MKITITKKKTQQKVNLKTLLGETPTEAQKDAFVSLASATIENRTLNGKDINNRKFTKYSKAYAAKKGVTRSSVDMFLEGDMLDDIDNKIDETRDTVTYGMVSSGEKLKSHNHNLGVTLPQREFFGLTDKEARKIAKQIKDAKPVEKQSKSFVSSALSLLDIEQTE